MPIKRRRNRSNTHPQTGSKSSDKKKAEKEAEANNGAANSNFPGYLTILRT